MLVQNKYVKTKKGYKRKTLKQKVYALERQARLMRPETKMKADCADLATLAGGAFSLFELTNVFSGSGEFQRIGNQISVTGVDIRVWMSTSRVQAWLVLSINGTVPGTTDFEACRGGHIQALKKEDFKELGFFQNYGSTNQDTNIKRTFNPPIRTEYLNTGGGDGCRNRIFLCLKNIDASSTHSFSFSYRMYYKDP